MLPSAAQDVFSLASLQQARALGTLYREAAAVVIQESVLEGILEYSSQDLTRERGGFLLGGVYGEAPQYVVIRHFQPAFEAESGSASLKFTHDTWSSLHKQLEVTFPGEAILGWQHTHPGFGIFLSAYDMFIHRNFFSQPWQVALVVDPKRQELGFFHWRNGEVQDCGFLCSDE